MACERELESRHAGSSYIRKQLRHLAAGVQQILKNFLRSYPEELAQYQHHPKHGLEGVRSRNPINIFCAPDRAKYIYIYTRKKVSDQPVVLHSRGSTGKVYLSLAQKSNPCRGMSQLRLAMTRRWKTVPSTRAAVLRVALSTDSTIITPPPRLSNARDFLERTFAWLLDTRKDAAMKKERVSGG